MEPVMHNIVNTTTKSRKRKSSSQIVQTVDVTEDFVPSPPLIPFVAVENVAEGQDGKLANGIQQQQQQAQDGDETVDVEGAAEPEARKKKRSTNRTKNVVRVQIHTAPTDSDSELDILGGTETIINLTSEGEGGEIHPLDSAMTKKSTYRRNRKHNTNRLLELLRASQTVSTANAIDESSDIPVVNASNISSSSSWPFPPMEEQAPLPTPGRLPGDDVLNDSQTFLQAALHRFGTRETEILTSAMKNIEVLPANAITMELFQEFKRLWFPPTIKISDDVTLWQSILQRRIGEIVKGAFYAIILRQYLINHQYALPDMEEYNRVTSSFMGENGPLSLNHNSSKGGLKSIVDSVDRLRGFIRGLKGAIAVGLSLTKNRNTLLYACGLLEGSERGYLFGTNPSLAVQRRLKLIEIYGTGS
jgi:hypothetical protein